MRCQKCGSKNLHKRGIDKRTDKQQFKCKDCGKWSLVHIDDLDVITENVRLAKQKQRQQDTNRIERKSFREYARVENAVGQYTKNLAMLFEKYNLSDFVETYPTSNRAVGVLQISDTHFNEMVDLTNNKYDFEIASARMKFFVEKAMTYFASADISNVLVCLTGDLLNSDRRLDELLSNATNRAKATFLAVDILQQAILHLNTEFNVSVASVTGNESRIPKDWGWADGVATDNYDFMIFNILDHIFRDSAIQFINGDPIELVVNVAGQNLLMLHGNGAVKHNNLETSVNQIVGRYGLKGIPIDYVIMGHQHSARLGDYYSRSASLVGANDYSDKGLNLSGRASQNCYIFYDDGNRDAIKIDLQNYYNGYNIDKSLEAYNSKSGGKTKQQQTIFKVVV